MTPTIETLKQHLISSGRDAITKFASDPNASDEILIFSYFFLPKVVEENPAWLLTKMSGAVSNSIDNIADEIDKSLQKKLPRDEESVRLLSDLIEEAHLEKDTQVIELFKIMAAHLLATGNKTVSKLFHKIVKYESQIDFYVRALDAKSSGDEGAKHLLKDPYLPAFVVFCAYVAFPDLAVHHPSWSLVKNEKPENLAKAISMSGIQFDRFDTDETFKSIDKFSQYFTFVMPIIKVMRQYNRDDGGLMYLCKNRLLATVSKNPKEFRTENILKSIPEDLRREVRDMLGESEEPDQAYLP